uniref:phage tail tape measure protein n=1 Tax=Rahnella sp. ChDrAdgB13 TaxID=1850581 RepID=UPI001AD85A73
MAGPFETQFGIGVNDNATPKIRGIKEELKRMQQAREQLGMRSERTIQREIDRTAAAYLRLARSGTLSASEQARAFDKMTSNIERLNREMGAMERQQEKIFRPQRNAAQEARETLGIRSERNIQREIAQTIAAYNRLERSGVMSANEQARAYEKMTSTVGKLRRELGETERTQSRMTTTFKTIGAVGGFIAGAGMALRKPITDAASYDAALRNQANFAYSGSDLAGRENGMKRIDQVIKDSVSSSGASGDEAFSGLETMMRSGVMSREQAYKFLPNVLRNAVATGADAASVANTQGSAVNFGLDDKDAPAALSVLTTMAQHGRIDVPTLAREMPRGLEAGKSAGFHGQRGFSQLAAFFEASAIGAKDPQDAATNANDFLAELTSSNLTNNAKRIKIGGKGIDIKTMMRKDLAKGLTPLDTVTNVIGKLDNSDPLYQKYQKQLTNATDPADREKLNAQIMQIHGQHISQLFPNQQARNAYINFDRNRDVFGGLTNEGVNQFGLPDGQRSADQDFDLVSAGSKWKSDRGDHVNELTSDSALGGAAGIWGDLKNEIADLEKQFPVLGEAVSGTTTAFKGLLSGLGGSVIGGAAGGWGWGKIKGWLSKGGSVVEDGIGTAEDIVGGAAGKPGLFGRMGSWLAGGGKRLVSGGADVLSDGLIDNPVTLALAGLIYPSDTV